MGLSSTLIDTSELIFCSTIYIKDSLSQQSIVLEIKIRRLSIDSIETLAGCGDVSVVMNLVFVSLFSFDFSFCIQLRMSSTHLLSFDTSQGGLSRLALSIEQKDKLCLPRISCLPTDSQDFKYIASIDSKQQRLEARILQNSQEANSENVLIFHFLKML